MKQRPIPVLLALLALAASLHAGEPGEDEYARHHEEGRCRCHEGKATWSYLRSPLGPPEDPPYCGFERKGSSCANRPRPPEASAACWGSRKEACFWRRHAWSWDIDCLTCLQDEDCTLCDDLQRDGTSDKKRVIEERLRSEQKTLKGPLWVAVSPHFYVVTNIDKRVKVRGRRGGVRLMSGHELAHLAAQRCEIAYDEFVHWFGGTYVLHKPMAVYIVDRRGHKLQISDRYFGGNGIHMNYAFNFGDRIAEGFSGNGFVVSFEEQSSDRKMHGFIRHQIGHILFSVWQLSEGFEKGCPRWAWIGAAHFLTKNLEMHKDYATYCFGEESGGEGPGKKWLKRVRQMAKKELPPIETFFQLSSLSAFSYEDHLRAWSIMDLMLREDRERWLKTLTALRHGADEGAAFKEHLGLTPVQFHKRWVERLTGKRRTMGTEDDAPEVVPEDPTRREREAILEATDPQVLAGRIKGLDVIRDPEVAAVVLQRLPGATDLVRETIHNLLAKTTDTEVLAWLRREGLYDPNRFIRAEVIRALGTMRDEASRPAIETMLEDREGMVRANAATALMEIHDPASRDALLAALDESDAKTWIPIADAYASFGRRPFKPASALIAKRLEDKRWQVRLTAARALARVGTEEALDALIARFAKETGLLEREFRAALRSITYDDLGPNPETWRTWWEQQKARHKGLPPRPEKESNSDHDQRYGVPEEEDDPTYYGKRFYSRAVCFVLDISDSMKVNMEIRPEQAASLGDVPHAGPRIDIARGALVNALQGVDPRTRFRIVLFESDIDVWQERLELANKKNVHMNARRLAYVVPKGETNFHGALKAALGLHGKSSLNARLEQIPDTVFFLTDGRPTKGEIQTMPELVSWLKDVNRFAKVVIHVIALGDLNVDAPELEKLAKAGGGTMIHVREK